MGERDHYLHGADAVHSASRTMSHAGDAMRSAASSMDDALVRHRTYMEEWIQRFEAWASSKSQRGRSASKCRSLRWTRASVALCFAKDWLRYTRPARHVIAMKAATRHARSGFHSRKVQCVLPAWEQAAKVLDAAARSLRVVATGCRAGWDPRRIKPSPKDLKKDFPDGEWQH